MKKVQKSTGEDEIILVTKKGQAIRFKEKEIREMGRPAAGVKGIRLKKGDELVGMDVIKNSNTKNQKPETRKELFIGGDGKWYGKRTDLKEYRLQGRGGAGLKLPK